MRRAGSLASVAAMATLAAACSLSCKGSNAAATTTSPPNDSGPPPHPIAADELALRHKLGIPDDAQRIVLFGQTSHLDIDWQKTFDDYYSTWVGNVFTSAKGVLEKQPRATYGIAEMAYLEHHLQAHPDELASMKASVSRGALHIIGGGMTSPDTLLPETEMLARDFLYGIRFAEDQLGAHPTAAWLPDSFGHSGTAPDVLAAAGYASVGFSRIDGAPDFYEILFQPGFTWRSGSTAASLFSLGSSDFLWKGAGGATVLAHFMSGKGLYCEGDNIDYAEGIQVPGGHTGSFKGDDPKFTDGQIDGYIDEMTPWSKTPYIFIPVGCDFQSPKERLQEYLDGYVSRHYATNKTWVGPASFDDYVALISHWKDVLPTVDHELSPYFMGFYGTRAGIKRGVRDAARPFFVAETFASALGADGATIMSAAAPTLSKLTRTDHHDFVTGTSNDAVYATEQLPLLADARKAGEAALRQVAVSLAKRVPTRATGGGRIVAFNASSASLSDIAELTIPIATGVSPRAAHATLSGHEVPMELLPVASTDTTATFRVGLTDVAPFSWSVLDLQDGPPAPITPMVTMSLLDSTGAPATGASVRRVRMTNSHVQAQWDANAGIFGLTSLVLDGTEVIAKPSMRVNDYTDDGGLWRLGHEMDSCNFTALPAPTDAETLTVLDSSPLKVRVAFVSKTSTREVSLGAGATGLTLAITTGAAKATTRTVSFSLAVPGSAALRTSQPAGYVTRAPEYVYSPTYWPAVAWAEVGGVAILLRQSTGVRMSTPGEVELMAVRNAQSEKCDVEGGVGTDDEVHRIEWRIERVASPAAAERASQAFSRPLSLSMVGTDQAPTTDLPATFSLASIDGDGVISAIKPAERGAGLIVRALAMPGPMKLHPSSALVGKSATYVDLAERDLGSAGTIADPVLIDGTKGVLVGLRLQ